MNVKKILRKARQLNSTDRRREAETAARKAIRHLRGLSVDTRLLAEAYGELGEAQWFLRGPPAALRAFREGRKLAESLLDDAAAEQLARMLDNEALCLHVIGRRRQAAAQQEKALTIVSADPKLAKRARWLRRRMANVAQDRGLFARASHLLAAARPPSRASVEERIGWLHSNALLAERWDRYAEAEQWYDRATALFEEKSAQAPAQVACLINAAMLKSDLGEPAQAKRLLDVAGRLAPQDPPISYYVKRAVADALLAARRGDIHVASRSMEIARIKAKERNAANVGYEHAIVAFHAELLAASGRMGEARKLLLSTISLPREGGEIGPNELALAMPLAEILLIDGEAIDLAGRLLKALLMNTPAGSETEWRILACIADLAAAHHNTARAIFFGKLAVMKIVRSLEPFPGGVFQRDAVLARRERPFLHLIARLVRAGRIVEAGRIRAILAVERAFNLASRTGIRARAPGTDMFGDREFSWLEAYETARRNLDVAAEFAAGSSQMASRSRLADTRLASARARLSELFDEVVRQDMSAPGARTTLATSLSAESTRPGTAILRYHLGTKECVVECVRSDGARFATLSASSEEIARDVFDFVALLRDARPPIDTARSLYRHLLLPLQPYLHGISRIEIFADGALASLPFCALHDGARFLVEQFEIAFRSGGDGKDRRSRPVSSLALFGVSRAWHGLPALAHVPAEVAGALRAFPEALTRLDRKFTAASLRSVLTAGTDAVHIASHHHLVPGSPSRSFLLLGDGERMSISTLLSERFDWSSTRLLFLSACETASSETLAAALHLRGVETLVATIWPVADSSTSVLASEFYRQIAVGRDLASTLRKAQLTMLYGHTVKAGALSSPSRGFGATKRSASFSHPYHWAAFKLFMPGW